MSEEQREKTLYNLIVRMRPVGTQYAITTTPITYNERNQRYEGCKSIEGAG